MKNTMLLAVAMLGLAGLAGCAETPPPPPPPVAQAAPPPPPAPATRGPIEYVCRRTHNSIMATFVATDPATVQLTYGDQNVTATAAETKHGQLYKADQVSFYLYHNVATVNWMGRKFSCTAKKE
jgi:hypothetical protein